VVAVGVGSLYAGIGSDALLRGYRRTRRRYGRRLARRCTPFLVRLVTTNDAADTRTDDRVLASDMTGHTADSRSDKTPLGTGLTGQQSSTGKHY
jgi:hypothetical protein